MTVHTEASVLTYPMDIEICEEFVELLAEYGEFQLLRHKNL